MPYYAKEDALICSAEKPIGAIEITKAEYNEAIAAKLSGRKVEVRNGALWIASTETRTVYNTDDGSEKVIADNDDTPEGYVTEARPSQHHAWDGSEWVRDDAAYLAAKKVEYEAAVEQHLNTVADAHDYNTIYSALSYIGSADPKWSAEASAFSDWRDAVWKHVQAMYASIEADFQQTGVLTIPELETVIDGLPAYTFEYVEPE